MYIEFIIIYIMLAISIALGVINLVFALRGKKEEKDSFTFERPTRQSTSFAQQSQQEQPKTAPQNNNVGSANAGVVFCRKCAHQFPADEKFCPCCGTPKN